MIDQGSTLARRDPQIRRAPNSAGLYDILDLILDKGIVIDAFVRVSLVGIELLTIDARVVIASVDTYLRYAEGAERLQLYNRSESQRLPEFLGKQGKEKMATAGIKTAGRIFGGNEGEDQGDKDDNQGEGITGKLAKGVRNVVGKVVHSVAGGGDDDDDDDDDRSQRRERPDRQERHNGHHGKPAKVRR